MGNASSTPRGPAEDGLLEQGRHARVGAARNATGPAGDGRGSRLAWRHSQSLRLAGQHASSLYDTFRRHRSSESVMLRPAATAPSHADAVVVIDDDDDDDEPDDRPLMGDGDTDLPDADALPLSPSSPPPSRTRTAMSRLGSRLLPDAVARGLLSSGEETEEEGQALRNGSAGRSRLSVFERPPSFTDNATGHRLSLAASLRRRSERPTDLRRRPIRGPYPLPHTSPLQPDPPHADPDAGPDAAADPDPDWFDGMRDVPTPLFTSARRRRHRLSRARDSLSMRSRMITSLFGHSSDQLHADHDPRESPPRAARVTFADESDHLLPPSHPADHRADPDDAPHELDAVEPEARTLLSGPRVTAGMSSIRRFQPGLRSRSTRFIRRGEHPPLSQVLQLAAAAIAAQLSSAAGHASGRPLATDSFDGSIQNFVQTLQDAATAQAGEHVDMNPADGDVPPVNFMRVFQFPNDEYGSPIASQAQSRDVDQMDLDSITGPGDADRSVTLVLVGVRSLPHAPDSSAGAPGTTLAPSLDTLLSLPFLPPANVLRNGSAGALFRRSERTPRSSPRRHSMTNFSFPAQYESQRHQRTRTPSTRTPPNVDEVAATVPEAGVTPSHLAAASDTPPGPHPPPSTPADVRSGHATPIRRPSSASGVHNVSLPELDEDLLHEDPAPAVPESSFTGARQRRRSDSEFARRPELGSGAARRNGVVEPDHSAAVGRSWLIYVVGTNVSPDHPAFTMPSLFTDNPSYEDMQMLSALLGPVKPPVATRDDVRSSGGLYRLVARGDGFCGVAVTETAAADDDDDDAAPTVDIGREERCLICLSEYEAAEEVRRLAQCQHRYHRGCIDEWLTTGRNSCPMCRSQGVPESGTGTGTGDETPVAPTS